MARLDQERQKRLEPTRIKTAKEKISALGYTITFEDAREIRFTFQNHTIRFFPYSGWHTGKPIKDGRGLQKLLDQISP